jgi:predicted phosphoribosyltransferase
MFRNRREAGELLGETLRHLNLQDPMLLAVPRGGLVVAEPVSTALKTGLGVLVTRKIGHPLNPEVAVGAVMPDGETIGDAQYFSGSGRWDMQQIIEREKREIRRRMKDYTGSELPPEVKGRTVVVIDDGIATGYTLRAAIKWLRAREAGFIVVAVPVGSQDSVQELAREADQVICLSQPEPFYAVGQFYQEFGQVEDSEAIEILKRVNERVLPRDK